MGKKIIWCGNSYYGSPFKVGCNYYSELLAKEGNEVLFIAPPFCLFHYFKKGDKNSFNQRLKLWKEGISEPFKNYKVLTPFTIFAPVNYRFFNSNFVLKNWDKLTIPNIYSQIKKSGFIDVDILVVDSYMAINFIKHIKYKKLIVRVTDNLEGFNVPKCFISAETHLIKSADKVVTTSYFLKNKIDKEFNVNATVVSNGVDIDKFQETKTQNIDFLDPKIFEKDVIVYVGAIEFWFDYNILNQLSEKFQNINFLIIGPIKHGSDIVFSKNVFFVGAIPNQFVPSILKKCKIGIIPFKKGLPIVETISPLKLYEYMAAGLPVISTKWKELEHIKSPAILCEDIDDYINGVEYIFSNKDYLIEKSLKYSINQTWKSKIDFIK